MRSQETKGMLIAFLGVIIFSATLPVTRLAIREFDAVWIALARVEIAALVAAVLLWIYRSPVPSTRQYPALALTALGVVLGFPILSSIAMKTSTASHGAVLVGLLPIMTAVFAALRAGERPSRAFWLASSVGTLIVVGFAWSRSKGGGFSSGDLAMMGAVVLGALGYAEGGKLARVLGGWQTIAWTLVFSAPFLLLPTWWLTGEQWRGASWTAWAALLYLALFSQLIGFFFWYGGMAIGGVARAAQAQLTQLFLTLFLSIWLLSERVDASTWLVAVAVILAVVATRRAPVGSQ
jgi:drug/metabolite transporter (DMT)-like permease